MLQSATEQQNSGGPLKGRAFIVTYQTKFQNGEGMETFTLVERDRPVAAGAIFCKLNGAEIVPRFTQSFECIRSATSRSELEDLTRNPIICEICG